MTESRDDERVSIPRRQADEGVELVSAVSGTQLLWRTEADGTVASEVIGYRLTVERLQATLEGRFAVWRLGDAPQLCESGVRPTVKEAMRAAEDRAISLSNKR